VALGFVGAMALIVGAMVITARNTPEPQPWTLGEILWQVLVLGACLAGAGAAVWWFW
jgi:hypothetical protein